MNNGQFMVKHQCCVFVMSRTDWYFLIADLQQQAIFSFKKLAIFAIRMQKIRSALTT